MKTLMPKITFASPSDGNPHHKSLLRQLCGTGIPASSHDAKCLLEECLARADGLTSVFTQYCWGDGVSQEDLRMALEVLDDLLYFSVGMLEFWRDEADLIKHGWTPPTREEAQR